ncbi:MAG: hypothetical protein ABI430_03235 [Candidatus Taylorbacteria bacterium]
MTQKIETVLPKPRLRHVKEIIGRLEERNPTISKDLKPADLCRVVLTMWFYGYAKGRRKVTA